MSKHDPNSKAKDGKRYGRRISAGRQVRRFWANLMPFEEDGDTWLPPGKFIGPPLNWSYHQLYHAQENGLLLLDGERLLTKKKEVHGIEIKFSSQKQRNQIIEATRQLKKNPGSPGQITPQDALKIVERRKKKKERAERQGRKSPIIWAGPTDPKTIRNWVKKGAPVRAPANGKLTKLAFATDRIVAKSKNGRPCKKVLLTKRKFMEILDKANSIPEGKITLQDFCESLTINEGTALDWAHSEVCPFLPPDETLIVDWTDVPTPQGPKPGVLFDELQRDRILEAMGRDITRSFTDKEGTWDPETKAEKDWSTTQRVLRYQASRNRLTVKQVPYRTRTARTGSAWFYLHSSLKSYFSPNHRLRIECPPAPNGQASNEIMSPADKPTIPPAEVSTQIHHAELKADPTLGKTPKRKAWVDWKKEGKTYGQIHLLWKKQTGEDVSRDMIKAEVCRLRKRGW